MSAGVLEEDVTDMISSGDESEATSSGGSEASSTSSDEARQLATSILPPEARGDDWSTGLALAESLAEEGKWDRAINIYTDLLRQSSIEGGTGSCPMARQRHKALLLARGAAYVGLSEHLLKAVPAAQSELRAINAPDPHHLAAQGTQDAEMTLALEPECAEALLLKGNALVLQERYADARDSYQAGLSLQPPTYKLLQRRLEALDSTAADDGVAKAADAAGGTQRQVQLHQDDFDCVICSRLLWNPVTTPCGHSFCRNCLARALDHSSRCPTCRTVLHVGTGELPTTIALKNLLERSFAEEYQARTREEEELAAAASAATGATLPLFVMSLLLPGQTMALNIFEPRYRLLVRRVMSGTRRFGMATVDRNHELCTVGCEVEVTECQPLPDGRYYIEVLGKRRFAPRETWELDGYRVAKVEFVTDDVPPAGCEAELQAAAAEVERLADAWMERLRGLAQTHRGLSEVLARAGGKPAAGDHEALSWWVANLVCPLLDQGRDGLVRRLMLQRNTLERLREEQQLLEQLSNVRAAQCSVM